MQADPSDLVQRAQQGDQAAFEALYRAHVGRVYALCLRLTADPVRAEELTQDAFVRAYRALAKMSPEQRAELRLQPWLYTITLNVTRNRLRGKRPTVRGMTMIDWVEANQRFDAPIIIRWVSTPHCLSKALRCG